MRLYIEPGIRPGNFLEAVVGNNLVESYARADDYTRKHMQDFVEFFSRTMVDRLVLQVGSPPLISTPVGPRGSVAPRNRGAPGS